MTCRCGLNAGADFQHYSYANKSKTNKNSLSLASVAQLVEHLVAIQKVESSNLFTRFLASVAQLVEHLICNQAVVGSNPI